MPTARPSVADLTAVWDAGFELLQRFGAREGHARVPRDSRDGDFRLGTWVDTQRAAFRHGRIDAARVEQLEALPGWTWTVLVNAWENGFEHLTSYVDGHGDALVPRRHASEDGYHLGLWVAAQRIAFRNGRLEATRATRLAALPDWSWARNRDAWERGLGQLALYVAREGHANVPCKHREGEYGLGGWVNAQRSSFWAGELQVERAASLAATPGWTWDALDAGWESGFAHLEHYIERNGHARVPRRHTEMGFQLGTWVARERMKWESGRLDPKRADRLACLPGWAPMGPPIRRLEAVDQVGPARG